MQKLRLESAPATSASTSKASKVVNGGRRESQSTRPVLLALEPYVEKPRNTCCILAAFLLAEKKSQQQSVAVSNEMSGFLGIITAGLVE